MACGSEDTKQKQSLLFLTNHGKTAWKEHNADAKFQVSERQLYKLRKQLLARGGALLHNSDGIAAVDATYVARAQLQLANSLDFLDTTETNGCVLYRVSADNHCCPFKKGNESLILQLVSVKAPHSLLCCHHLAEWRAEENLPVLQSLVGASNLKAFLRVMDTDLLLTTQGHLPGHVLFVFDWKTLAIWLGCPSAKEKGQAPVCPFCGITKTALHDWHAHPYDYQFVTLHVGDFGDVAIPELDISDFRYDFMHLIANSTNLCLKDVAFSLRSHTNLRRSVKELVQDARKDRAQWNPKKTGNKVCITPSEAKQFWEEGFGEQLAQLLRGSNDPDVTKTVSFGLPTAEGNQLVTTSVGEALAVYIEMLFLHYVLGYTLHPNVQYVTLVLKARTVLLAIRAGFHFDLTPTAHYLATHFWYFFFLDDGDAYLLLQEAPENLNKQFNSEYHHHTCRNRFRTESQKSAWDVVMERQTVKLELALDGVFPHNFQRNYETEHGHMRYIQEEIIQHPWIVQAADTLPAEESTPFFYSHRDKDDF